MKYIMFEDNSFVIFTENIVHRHVCNHKKPISAGFISIGDTYDGLQVKTYGVSISLNLLSNKDDAKIIQDGIYD